MSFSFQPCLAQEVGFETSPVPSKSVRRFARTRTHGASESGSAFAALTSRFLQIDGRRIFCRARFCCDRTEFSGDLRARSSSDASGKHNQWRKREIKDFFFHLIFLWSPIFAISGSEQAAWARQSPHLKVFRSFLGNRSTHGDRSTAAAFVSTRRSWICPLRLRGCRGRRANDVRNARGASSHADSRRDERDIFAGVYSTESPLASQRSRDPSAPDATRRIFLAALGAEIQACQVGQMHRNELSAPRRTLCRGGRRLHSDDATTTA